MTDNPILSKAVAHALPDDISVYTVASWADVASPDDYDSPAARWLKSAVRTFRDDAGRVIGEDGDIDSDVIHEMADGHVPVYTSSVWSIFCDLAAWQEKHPFDEGGDEWPAGDPTKNAMLVLFGVAERAFTSMAERVVEAMSVVSLFDDVYGVQYSREEIEAIASPSAKRTVDQQKAWIKIMGLVTIAGYTDPDLDDIENALRSPVLPFDMDDEDTERVQSLATFLSEAADINDMDELADLSVTFVERLANDQGWCLNGTYRFLNAVWDEHVVTRWTSARTKTEDERGAAWVWHDTDGRALRGSNKSCGHCFCGHECTRECITYNGFPITGTPKPCAHRGCGKTLRYVVPTDVPLSEPGFVDGMRTQEPYVYNKQTFLMEVNADGTDGGHVHGDVDFFGHHRHSAE